MKILLAIDESECSQAATRAVIAQFPRAGADVRVLNVDEWPNRLPTSLAFAEGPARLFVRATRGTRFSTTPRNGART